MHVPKPDRATSPGLGVMRVTPFTEALKGWTVPPPSPSGSLERSQRHALFRREPSSSRNSPSAEEKEDGGRGEGGGVKGLMKRLGESRFIYKKLENDVHLSSLLK